MKIVQIFNDNSINCLHNNNNNKKYITPNYALHYIITNHIRKNLIFIISSHLINLVIVMCYKKEA